MKFSIIIPVYNTGAYLEKCVRSALVSSDEDCEILLVDDGSTDGISGTLCDQLARMYSPVIRVIHQQNKGLGGARNTGIEHAAGEYLLFLDSDDRLHPDAISCIRRAIEEYTVEEYTVDIVAFNITTEDENGKTKDLISGCLNQSPFALEDNPQFMLELPSACNKAWHRSLFLDSNIRFPERVWYEDIRTTVKLYALAKKIYMLPDCLYIYFQRSDSIMHSGNLERNREIIDAMEDIVSWYKEKGLYDRYRDMLCMLAVENIYICASNRVIREDPKHPLIKLFRQYLRQSFSDYRNNHYLGLLSRTHKLSFVLLEHRLNWVIYLMFNLKDKARKFW